MGAEFLNWVAGDLALESQAHFLAIAQHRLVPARARNAPTQLRQACISSVLALVCQDVTPGGHGGGGVVSLQGAPWALPACAAPFFCFSKFFRQVVQCESSSLWRMEVSLTSGLSFVTSVRKVTLT